MQRRMTLLTPMIFADVTVKDPGSRSPCGPSIRKNRRASRSRCPPFVSTQSHDFRLPVLAEEPAASWVAEGAEIPVTDPASTRPRRRKRCPARAGLGEDRNQPDGRRGVPTRCLMVMRSLVAMLETRRVARRPARRPRRDCEPHPCRLATRRCLRDPPGKWHPHHYESGAPAHLIPVQ